MSIRILHTADWQIGKGFGQIPGDEGALLREQRFKTAWYLAELAAHENVDAVLVAGDVFDAQTVSDQAIRRVCEAMKAYAGPWVVLPGNHDAALAASVWTRMQVLACKPENVYLALDPQPILLAGDRLAVLPAPLKRRHEAEDLTAWFDESSTPAGAVRVGLAHGTVLNRLPEQGERHNPIADDRAESASLDYLALGDWHGTLNIARRTWYAGTPETDGFRNNEPGHVLLVTLPGGGGEPEVSQIPTTHYRWHAVDATVSDQTDVDAIEHELLQLGEESDRQVVRLRLKGTVSLGTREALEQRIAGWQARLRYLAVDDSELLPRATEEDLAALRAQGFVGQAVERLVALSEDPTDSDQPFAMDALQRLFMEHRALSRQQ